MGKFLLKYGGLILQRTATMKTAVVELLNRLAIWWLLRQKMNYGHYRFNIEESMWDVDQPEPETA